MSTYYARTVQSFKKLTQHTRLVIGRSRLRNDTSSPSRSPVGPAQYTPLLLSPHFELPQTMLGSAITCSYFIPTFLQRRRDSPRRRGGVKSVWSGSLWLWPVFLHSLRRTGLFACTQQEVLGGCGRRAGEAETCLRMLCDRARG